MYSFVINNLGLVSKVGYMLEKSKFEQYKGRATKELRKGKILILQTDTPQNWLKNIH